MEMLQIQLMTNQVLLTAFFLSFLPLAVSMLVGFIFAVLQAATQIQEQTLSFVPKILSVAAVLYITAPYFSRLMTDLMTQALLNCR